MAIGLGGVSSDYATATDGIATITIAAVANVRPYLTKIVFSYSTDPAAGRVTVQVGGVTKLSFAVVKAGPGPLNLNIRGNPSENMTIAIAAGGGGNVGDIYAEWVNQPGG